MTTPLPLALTMGDPAGCGPQITARAWEALKDELPGGFYVIADPDLYSNHCPVTEISEPPEARSTYNKALPVLSLQRSIDVKVGEPSTRAAPQIISSIEKAVLAIKNGLASAVVTNPINKAVLYESGFPHPGHTEYLGKLCEDHFGPSASPVMMLVGGGLKVALATVHMPLMKVADALTLDRLSTVAHIVHSDLQTRFSIESPRLAFTGLNPHAGENGAIGREEIELINPAAEVLRREGVNITDARPADTIFAEALSGNYDAVIAMTHDQGLIPVKTLDFWGGVNCTLGLPFIRTSPDHGTAYEAAARGDARPDSLIAAIRLAADMAGARMSERQPLTDAPARKALGQHFLHDPDILRRTALAAGPVERRTVIEVGPGPGGLTRALLEEGAAKIIAVEADERFAEALRGWPDAQTGRLHIHQRDARKVGWEKLIADAGGKTPAMIVANLPYNVGTPLLVNWLKAGSWRGEMALMFQKEVAERVCAQPNTKAYGRLAILAQAVCKTHIAFTLPPGAFKPPPKIDSAVAVLTPLPDEVRFKDLKTLEALAGAAFGQRRKMLRACLKPFAKKRGLKAEEWLEANGVDPTARAETLSQEEFRNLAASLA